ncbi:MAG: DUF488 domain-containing protein [Candidatus Nitrosopolaris sp.]
MARQIFTIGHSIRQWNDFIFLLQANHVDLLVDVRRYAGSELCPQFNKEEMAKELKKKNIVYTHIEKLGGRRKNIISKNANNDGWKNKSFRAYADYMTTMEFRQGINELLSLITRYDTVTIMCTEVVPWRCHKRMIADYLIMLEGVSVSNIIDSKHQPSRHEVTSFACLIDNYLISYSDT